ncbi:unnamed protein product [Kuraishia capsulata CBS 1993]|uniref:Cytochrome c oxidase assembly factor 1 n=1 Tax=Kuraishia capsulata CBS 1993 TaxID=1382522 RepID=W6MTT3_9ASCO|nr:uncharacterized protein KUCA_T00005897001 [Kuraishia capsulata CBS 1993]CDK29903.1 unnamed protein product [Kuraishia capsulata CBS 1993]
MFRAIRFSRACGNMGLMKQCQTRPLTVSSKHPLNLLMSPLNMPLRTVHSKAESIQHTADELSELKDGRRPMTVHDDLPDPLREGRLNKTYFVCFSILMSGALFGIFNYEKTSSPVMNATMYCLRRSDFAREAIGKEITFAGTVPWVHGILNTMKGQIDIGVNVQGNIDTAKMELKANRDSRLQEFTIERWNLVLKNGKVINLLDDPSIEIAF